MTTQKHNNKRLAFLLSVLAIVMFGFGFALVPIYNVMCKTLGINGKTGEASHQSSKVDTSRTIEIVFLAHTHGDLNWKFQPLHKKIVLHPGENKRIAYFARNNTEQSAIVQAIPSVTPGRAAKYLKKTECFCFTQQTLNGKASMEMPILFHIDQDLPSDIKEIALSYTLFDVTYKKINSTPPLRRIASE